MTSSPGFGPARRRRPSSRQSSRAGDTFSATRRAQEQRRVAERTQERIAKNNTIFRDANEHIRAKAEEYQSDIERIPFLCECPREDCTELVPLTTSEYSEVRSNDSHFFMVPDHADAERPLGTVVQREDGYVIVEKDVSSAET